MLYFFSHPIFSKQQSKIDQKIIALPTHHNQPKTTNSSKRLSRNLTCPLAHLLATTTRPPTCTPARPHERFEKRSQTHAPRSKTAKIENPNDRFYQKYNELRARIKANSCPILPANANANAAAANKSNNNNNLSSNNYHNNNNNNNKSDLLLGYAAGTTTTTSTPTTTTTTTSSTFNNTHSNTNNTSTTQQQPAAAAAASAANQLYSVQRSASLKDNSMYYRFVLHSTHPKKRTD